MIKTGHEHFGQFCSNCKYGSIPIVEHPCCDCWIEKEGEIPNKFLLKDDDSTVNDNVNHPAHYTQGGVECIDAIRACMTDEEFIGYCKGCTLKYVWRFEHKGGTEDLKKAAVYLHWLTIAKDALDYKEKQREY